LVMLPFIHSTAVAFAGLCVGSLAFGLSTNVGSRLALALVGAWSRMPTEHAPGYSVISLAIPSIAMAATRAILAHAPLTEGHLEGLLYVLAYMAAARSLQSVLFPDSRVFRPQSIAAFAFDTAPLPRGRGTPTGQGCLRVCEVLRDWSAGPFLPMRLLLSGALLLYAGVGSAFPIMLYYLEDHTHMRLSGHAASWLAAVGCAVDLIAALSIQPIVKCLQRGLGWQMQQPHVILIAVAVVCCALVPAMALAPYHLGFGAFSYATSLLTVALSNALLLPAILATTTQYDQIERDTAIVLSSVAIGPSLLSLLACSILDWHGSEHVEGRARPRYSIESYSWFGALITVIMALGAGCWIACASVVRYRDKVGEEGGLTIV